MINKIIHGDCLNILPSIKAGTFDCVVTSPPYNLGGDFHTFTDGHRVTYGSYNSFEDNMPEEKYQEWQVNVINECHRVLKDSGFMFYNHKNRIKDGVLISPHEWILKTNFFIKQVIVMNLKSTANVDKVRFFPVHELIYVLTKNKQSKLNNLHSLTDVWEANKVPRKETGHPATFHIDIPIRCIEASTIAGELVLDPFMGSGTTAEACVALERKYTGIEIDKRYVNNNSVQRLSEVQTVMNF